MAKSRYIPNDKRNAHAIMNTGQTTCAHKKTQKTLNKQKQKNFL